MTTLTNEEIKIIDIFRRNPLKEFTISEIMKEIKKKSYCWTYNAIKKLEKKEILKIKKSGKTKVISIMLSNQNAIAWISHLDKIDCIERKIPNIDEITDYISQKTAFFSLIVFGSYADKTNTKSSDIDIAILVKDDETRKEITPYAKNAIMHCLPKIDLHILTEKDFLEMLTNKDENLGKQIFRKHLLFFGADAYYQIIKEAKLNGLQYKI